MLKLPFPQWLLPITLGLLGASLLSAQDADPIRDVSPQPARVHGRVGEVVYAEATDVGALTVRRWILVGRPQGSHASLGGLRSPTLRFVPDVSGVYTVEALTPGGPPSRLKISAGPAKTLVPVETRVSSAGGGFNVVVNGHIYPGLPSANSISVLTLRRTTLEPLRFSTFDTTGGLVRVRQYLNAVLAEGTRVLTIISSGQRVGGDIADIAAELEQLGATTEFRNIHDPNFTFTFIGFQGLKPGQAHEVGINDVNLRGYFAPDSRNNYTFLQTDYVTFTLTPSTNLGQASTIQVGDKTPITSEPIPQGEGGFLLAVLDRATLETKFSGSYSTLASAPNISIAQQQALLNKLNSYQSDRNVLLFLTSFGRPHNGAAPGAPTFGRLAQTIDGLGGTYEAVYNVNYDTYSLAACICNYTPEAGSQINPDQPDGIIRGVLARGRQGNWYGPVTSAGPVGNLDLYRIIAQRPEVFPHPATGNLEEQNAYDYIGRQLCEGCDFRTTYSDSHFTISSLIQQLKDLSDPAHPGANCNSGSDLSAFCTVRNQLLAELGYADFVRNFSKNVIGLWDSNQGNVGLTLNSVYNEIDASLKSNAVVPSSTLGILQNVLKIGSLIPGPTGPVFGVVSAGFSFGADLANAPDGNSTVVNAQAKASELAAQAVESFLQERAAQGVLFASIYDDWGKLQTLGKALRSSSPEWAWVIGTTDTQLLDGLNRSTRRSFYQSLLPTVYVRRIWNAQKSQWSKVTDYKYGSSILNYIYYSIFPNWPEPSYLDSSSPRVDPATGKNAKDFLVLTRPGDLGFKVGNGYGQPDRQILDNLFDSLGLAIYKPEMYRHWNFTTFWCSAPLNQYYNKDSVKGSNCEFKTPQEPQ